MNPDAVGAKRVDDRLDVVGFTAFGSGFTWGGALVRW